MIQFDKATLIDWETRGIHKISIELISSGCEGTSILIHENIIHPSDILITNLHGIQIYAQSTALPLLQESFLTRVGGKWILKSDKILTRCGCGKSFGLKTGNAKIDKIKLLKSKLAKKEIHHHA